MFLGETPQADSKTARIITTKINFVFMAPPWESGYQIGKDNFNATADSIPHIASIVKLYQAHNDTVIMSVDIRGSAVRHINNRYY
jgi:hypothetical protein